MQFWNEIINTALLGTEKKPVATADLPEALKEAAALLHQREATDAEEKFLQLAALSFNFRQSGIKPIHQPALVFSEAAPETSPYCSSRAGLILRDIMTVDSAPLFGLWLEQCIAAQQLVVPDLIPILLDRGVHQRKIQEAIATVCGRRGEWLSRLNPAWKFSSTADDEQLWQTGQPDQRKAALWRMRQQDPAKAREWLTQTWPQENANMRTELLKQLDGTIQPEDEPLLIDQQNDRSQKVKEEAIRLWKQLPGGILVTRYAELVRSMIFVKREKALLGMMTKTSLQIYPPVIPDKGEYLPGIEKLSNDKFFTDGEFALYQLMQNIPPAFWEDHFALPPGGILDLFSGANEKYVPAFVKATVQFRDQKWAQVYLDHREVFYATLLDLLPPAQQEAYCLRNFKNNHGAIIDSARNWPGEWPFQLAKTIIQHTAKNPYEFTIGFYRANIARIPIVILALLDGFGPSEPAKAPFWTNIANQVKRLLALKEQTLNAFNE